MEAPLEWAQRQSADGWEVDLTPYTLACFFTFTVALPLTHALGLAAHCPKQCKARHVLLYPLVGGRTHAIFSVLAWAVWVLSLLIAVPALTQRGPIPSTHLEALLGAAAVGAVWAELFCIKSLLVFEPRPAKAGVVEPLWNLSHLPSADAASGAVVGMGLLWAIMGAALLLATEYLTNRHSKITYCILSGLCLLTGATTTHGLGGALRHKGGGRWKFWQPFQGGTAFVATQGAGWALFAGSLLSLLWLAAHVTAGVAARLVAGLRAWVLATGATMFAAQLLLGTSIWIYNGKELVSSLARVAIPRAALPPKTLKPPWHSVWLPILMLYTPVHFLVSCIAVSFAALPLPYAAALWVGGLTIYYSLTSTNKPEHTGSREWPAYRRWIMGTMEISLKAWFGHVEVVRDGSSALDPAGKYIFAYHPHGLFPIGVGYLPLLPAFRRLLPGIDPVPLVASVVFFVPVIRDFCSWAGFRHVSRRTFMRALRERGAVLFVPGGQAELIHTHRSFRRQREWVVVTHHKGFVRLAIEEGAALIPTVVMGEVDSLRNFIDMPRVQAWSYKRLGFPIPYLVVGRWGLSPFPRRTGLKFVIGEPIAPPPHTAGEPVPQELVDALHRQHYAAVVDLFERHKASFPGYENVRLAIEHG